MASEYGWIITRDHLESKDVTIIGPSDVGSEMYDSLMRGEGEEFRLYDDDGNLYFSGKIIGDYSGFEPLDDYGEPDSGCTEVRTINPKTKKWETL